MARIEVSQTTNEDGTTHAHLKCPPLNGKKPSEIVSIELEYRIKALPIPEACKEDMRILIAAYAILKEQNQ